MSEQMNIACASFNWAIYFPCVAQKGNNYFGIWELLRSSCLTKATIIFDGKCLKGVLVGRQNVERMSKENLTFMDFTEFM